jgi:hypothetical protein
MPLTIQNINMTIFAKKALKMGLIINKWEKENGNKNYFLRFLKNCDTSTIKAADWIE